MPDLIRQGAKWLAGMHHDWATTKVTYRRGTSSILVPASRGRIVTEVETTDGLLLSHEQWTWVIDVNDLVIDGLNEEPRAGDQIIDSPTGDGPIYEVAALPKQTVWNWADAFQTRYKIFSKRIGNNNIPG